MERSCGNETSSSWQLLSDQLRFLSDRYPLSGAIKANKMDIYHERQQSNFCALHVVNALLQSYVYTFD